MHNPLTKTYIIRTPFTFCKIDFLSPWDTNKEAKCYCNDNARNNNLGTFRMASNFFSTNVFDDYDLD